MEVQGKYWGKTSPIFHRNNVEIHRLEGRKGGFSSEHLHRAKSNMFVVERGKIRIIAWKDRSGRPDETVLGPGDTSIVPPGLYHKFEVVEDCVAYEIYWVELDPEDIKRRNHGGTR